MATGVVIAADAPDAAAADGCRKTGLGSGLSPRRRA
jgi:hypothetical protein